MDTRYTTPKAPLPSVPTCSMEGSNASGVLLGSSLLDLLSNITERFCLSLLILLKADLDAVGQYEGSPLMVILKEAFRSKERLAVVGERIAHCALRLRNAG